MSEALKIAFSQLGVKEISGANHNQTIVDYAKQSGFEWINDDETPWCSVFMNWCAMKAGFERTNKANARSWLQVGNETREPKPGDVVIFKRGKSEWQGHVGFFLGFASDGNVFVLGGNQGNKVSIATYSKRSLLGFRTLGDKKPKIKILRRGSTGAKVLSFQKLLTKVGYDLGKPDGIFGGDTEKALIDFQEDNGLDPDGVYGPNTRKVLLMVAG